MPQSIDIRRNEKLIFSNNVESYKFDVSPDGSVVTATFNLTEPIPQPEVQAHDIDDIHARLQAEAAAVADEPAADPEADADANADETPDADADADAEGGEAETPAAKKRSSRASR